MSDEVSREVLAIVKRLESKVDGLEGTVNGLKGTVNGVEGTVTGLEGSVGGLSEKFTVLEHRVGTIERNMATKDDVAEIPYIKQTVTETSEKVNKMDEEMVRKEDLQYIQDQVWQHDRDIYYLKKPSF